MDKTVQATLAGGSIALAILAGPGLVTRTFPEEKPAIRTMHAAWDFRSLRAGVLASSASTFSVPAVTGTVETAVPRWGDLPDVDVTRAHSPLAMQISDASALRDWRVAQDEIETWGV
jgi:hypothetical protein